MICTLNNNGVTINAGTSISFTVSNIVNARTSQPSNPFLFKTQTPDQSSTIHQDNVGVSLTNTAGQFTGITVTPAIYSVA